MKTFIVDDSEPMRIALAQIVQSIPGAKVIGQAVDSDEAVGAILRTRPDLVLLDLTLRTGSGLPVLQTVKLLRPNTRIFVVTNHTGQPYRDRCAQAGADQFFDKSTELDALHRACGALAGALSRPGDRGSS